MEKHEISAQCGNCITVAHNIPAQTDHLKYKEGALNSWDKQQE